MWCAGWLRKKRGNSLATTDHRFIAADLPLPTSASQGINHVAHLEVNQSLQLGVDTREPHFVDAVDDRLQVLRNDQFDLIALARCTRPRDAFHVRGRPNLKKHTHPRVPLRDARFDQV